MIFTSIVGIWGDEFFVRVKVEIDVNVNAYQLIVWCET